MAKKSSRNFNTSLKNLTYRLRKFREILDNELLDVVQLYSDEICNAIREQMWEGINGYSDNIEPPYATRTIKNKMRKQQPTDRVTLKDSGKFYDSFEIDTESTDGFIITSTGAKSEALIKKYGTSIFRLTDSNLTKIVRDYMRPELQKRMKQYLLKK